ncbi:30S ribosomal protein S9 [Halobacteriales archaeon QH_2_65_14]|nr:MAG: 30S ribosomal protein S9 [Halobacteriales archaeon QH_2_65_14]
MVTNTSGKKKTAIARATVREGTGKVRINARPVELVDPEMARLKMLEPFRVVENTLRDDVDVDVSIEGGGVMGQADAARTAIARGLVQHTNDAELRDAYMEFALPEIIPVIQS